MLISNMSKVRFLRMKLSEGFTLVEVLATLVITAIGLFGIIELQNRNQIANLEATQRAYATIIANNMAESIRAQPTIGEDCDFPENDDFIVPGFDKNNVSSASSRCDSIKKWDADLRGALEREGDGNDFVGSITDGRGCIHYSTPVPLIGTPARYKVSVAWQGIQKTKEGGLAGSCGHGSYGDSRRHRLVSLDVYPDVRSAVPPDAPVLAAHFCTPNGSNSFRAGDPLTAEQLSESDGQFMMKWEKLIGFPDSTEYRLEEANVKVHQWANTGKQFCSVTDRKPNGTLSYKVKACPGGAVCGPPSNLVIVTVNRG